MNQEIKDVFAQELDRFLFSQMTRTEENELLSRIREDKELIEYTRTYLLMISSVQRHGRQTRDNLLREIRDSVVKKIEP